MKFASEVTRYGHEFRTSGRKQIKSKEHPKVSPKIAKPLKNWKTGKPIKENLSIQQEKSNRENSSVWGNPIIFVVIDVHTRKNKIFLMKNKYYFRLGKTLSIGSSLRNFR
jgi:hypothetical protein